MILKNDKAVYLVIPFLFLIIYFQVFFVNYAYLDEIFQLWHNNDDTNFRMFHTQGRWLAGLLFQRFFSSIKSIDQIKILRLFSLAGWMGTSLVCSSFLRKWTRLLNMSEQTWWLSSVYMVCSLSVCVYIGFASCFEVFLGVIFGLLSGHILFKSLYQQQKGIHLSNLAIVGSFFTALISLFIYQPSFGIFLIPFVLYYFERREAKPNRIVVTGVVFYLLAFITYYFLFKYSLRAYNLEASTRTEIHFNFFKKLSFFFAGPFPNGFSMNLLFSASSLFSQIFYPVVFVTWLVITFRRNGNNFIRSLIFVGFILFLLALVYFPSMIAAENFPSYRTLFVFDLAVFAMVIDSLLFLFKKGRTKWAFTFAGVVWVIVTGFYAFNVQFINPLKKEYSTVRSYFEAHYNSNVSSIYFIRADKHLFNAQFGTDIYRDEFGAPSTYRDWVPEPIVRQMIFELTKSRKIAEQPVVTQFENENAFDSAKVTLGPNDLLINVNELFKH